MENQQQNQVIGGSKRIVALNESPLPSNNDHHIEHQVRKSL